MLAVLRRRSFALLWCSALISETGDWLLLIGLPIYVYLLTRSALQTSTLFVVELLPTVFLGSVAGVFVDRWNRRQTLLVGNGLQGIVLLALLAVHSPATVWIVYVVALTESLISQLIDPAFSALLPSLVEEEHMVPANSLVAVNANLARLVGAPLGGFVVGIWSLDGVVLLDSASFFLAMILILGVTALPRVGEVGPPRASLTTWLGIWQDWLAGLALIQRNRTISILFSIGGLQQAAQGIFLVLYVIWVLRVVHGGPSGVGWLRGVQAIGGLLGGLSVAWLGARMRPPSLIGFGTLVFGLIELAIWNSPSVLPGLALPTILFVAVGLPGAAFGAGLMTMLQASTPDQYRGRVFGAIGAVFAILQVVGMVLAGIVGDRVGVLPMLNAQAGIYIGTGVLALLLLGSR